MSRSRQEEVVRSSRVYFDASPPSLAFDGTGAHPRASCRAERCAACVSHVLVSRWSRASSEANDPTKEHPMGSAPPLLDVGTVIDDRYEIRWCPGKGNLHLYGARDLIEQQDVVLRFLRGPADDAQLRERL